MIKKSRVLTVGCVSMNLIQKMWRMPHAGETVVEEKDFEYLPGGHGLISALTFAGIGADTVFCSKVGADKGAKTILDMCAASGIDTRFVTSDDKAPTGLASIMLEERGEARCIIYPGASRKLTRADVEDSFTSYPDAVFSQCEIPADSLFALAQFAYEKEIPLFLDMEAVQVDFQLERLKKAEVIMLNEAETKRLTGVAPDSFENCLRACVRLSAMIDVRHTILKLGSRGSYVYDGKYYQMIPAYKVNVVDLTGAGDVFSAGVAYAYMKNGGSIHAAVRFATAAAAICVSRAGGASSVPTLSEIKRFVEANQDD